MNIDKKSKEQSEKEWGEFTREQERLLDELLFEKGVKITTGKLCQLPLKVQ